MRPSQLTLIHSVTRKRLVLTWDEAVALPGMNATKLRDALRGKCVSAADWYVTRPVFADQAPKAEAAPPEAPAADTNKPVEHSPATLCWLCFALSPPN